MTDFTISLSGEQPENYSIADIFTTDGALSVTIPAKFISDSKFKTGVTITMNKNCILTLNNNDLFLKISTGVTFNGNSKTLTLAGTESNYGGLIACFGGNVKNLNVEVTSSNVHLGFFSSYFGGWICRAAAYGTINYCSSSGPISNNCGGICGSSSGVLGTCSINNCYSTGSIGVGAGGICGSNSNSKITSCFSSGTINNGGGICGEYCDGDIDSCYSTGEINNNGGGICGQFCGGKINNSYSTGTINNSGGICAQYSISSTIVNCFSSGIIVANSDAIAKGVTATNCYGRADSNIINNLPATWDTNKWEKTNSYPILKIFKTLPWIGYNGYDSKVGFFFGNFEITNNDGVLTTFPGATSYLWDNNTTAYTRTITQSGTYSVTITFEDFSVSKSITILEPTLSITKTVNNGIITLTANPVNGIGAYTYLWNNSATTKSINVESGDYSVAVTSGTETATATYSVLSATIAINGTQLIVNATGGTGSYTYLWDNGETGQTITPIIPGKRSVTVTSGDQSFLFFSDSTSDDIIISNDNNGNLSVTSGDYTYKWTKDSETNSLSTTNTLQISLPGTYSVKISSGADSVTRSITINPISVTITNSFGTLSTNLTGNYTYLWSDGSRGATTKAKTSLCKVNVFSPDNLLGYAEITLGSLSVNVSYSEFGYLSANVSGGTGPYEYLWFGQDSDGEITQTIRAKDSKTYTVYVYSSNSVGSASYSVPNTSITPGIDASLSIRFNDATQKLYVDNPFLATGVLIKGYYWSTGGTGDQIDPVNGVNSYWVAVYIRTSGNGQIYHCIERRTYSLIPGLTVTITRENNTTLRASAPVPGGYQGSNTVTYAWINGPQGDTRTINSPGVYTVNASLGYLDNGIQKFYSGTGTITILDAGAALTNNNNGTLSVTSIQGATYQWITPSNLSGNLVPITEPVVPQVYNVIIYSDGKISNLSKTITRLTNVSISRSGTILTASPSGYHYKWNSDQVTTTNTKTITTGGTYSVIVYGDDSIGSASFTIAPLSVTYDNDARGTMTAAAIGGTNTGYTYLWKKSNKDSAGEKVTVDLAATYIISVTDSYGSKAYNSIDIKNLNAKIKITNNLDGTLTAGPQFPNDTTAYNFKWNTNTNFGNTTNITNGNKDSPVTYTVTAYSSNGYGTASLTINNISVNLTRDGDKVVAPPGYTYKWSGGQNTDHVVINNAGTYSVTVYSTNSYGVGSLAIGLITPVINSSGSTLSVAGSYDYYLWSNGSNTPTITIASSGTYSVKVFSGNNFGSASITINNLIVNINFNDDGNLVASAADATSFSWNDGTTGPIKSGVNIGTTYMVTASSNNASGSKSVTLTNAKGPSDSRSIVSSPNNPGYIGFYTVDDVKAYIWNDGVKGNEREVNRSGDYSITIYFQSGNSYSIGTWAKNIPQLNFVIESYPLIYEFFPPKNYSNSTYKHTWSVVGAASITPDNDSTSIYYRSARPKGAGTYTLTIAGAGGYGVATRIIKPLTVEIKFSKILDEDGYPIHFLRAAPSGGDGLFYHYKWSYIEPNAITSSDGDLITLTSKHGSIRCNYEVKVSCIGFSNSPITARYYYDTPINRRPLDVALITSLLPKNSDDPTISTSDVISWMGNLFSGTWLGKTIKETSDSMAAARRAKESEPKKGVSLPWKGVDFTDEALKTTRSWGDNGQNSFEMLIEQASKLK